MYVLLCIHMYVCLGSHPKDLHSMWKENKERVCLSILTLTFLIMYFELGSSFTHSSSHSNSISAFRLEIVPTISLSLSFCCRIYLASCKLILNINRYLLYLPYYRFTPLWKEEYILATLNWTPELNGGQWVLSSGRGRGQCQSAFHHMQ